MALGCFEQLRDFRRDDLPGQAKLVFRPAAQPAARVGREPGPIVISCCELQRTTKEIASVNLKIGPPFEAVNFWPSSSNAMVRMLPFGTVLSSGGILFEAAGVFASSLLSSILEKFA